MHQTLFPYTIQKSAVKTDGKSVHIYLTSKQNINQTIEQVHTFDHQTTGMLIPIEQDIQSRFQKGSIKVDTYTKETITPIRVLLFSHFILQKSLNERRLFNNLLFKHYCFK